MVIRVDLATFFKLVSGNSIESQMLKVTFVTNKLMLGSKVKVKASPDSGNDFIAICFISEIKDENPSDSAGNFTLALDFAKYGEE